MQGSSQPPFDLAAHQRERIRALERDVGGLEQTRDELLRVLALTVRVAAGKDCDPITLMRVIEEMDRLEQADANVHPAVRDARECIQLEEMWRATQAAEAAA